MAFWIVAFKITYGETCSLGSRKKFTIHIFVPFYEFLKKNSVDLFEYLAHEHNPFPRARGGLALHGKRFAIRQLKSRKDLTKNYTENVAKLNYFGHQYELSIKHHFLNLHSGNFKNIGIKKKTRCII